MAEIFRMWPDTLQSFATRVFEAAGLAAADAADAADVLVWANRRGVDTHGVRNLKNSYVERLIDAGEAYSAQHISRGRINPRPEYRIDHETPFSARVDGGGGLGLAAACWGMRQAITRARQAGIGLVTMHNSHHFGAAGHHAYMAIPEDMIGISLTGFFFADGADQGVLPTFGARGMLSTNPISVAFPTGEELPFLLDMATSVAPMNRVIMMKQAGQMIPEGWGLDADLQPTTDPDAVRFLLPLGGSREQGGHKGYGLALVVEVLCAVLSGGWMEQAPAEGSEQSAYGQTRDAHFFGAIRVDAFRPVGEFKRGMDALIRSIHAAPPAPGHDHIYYPGEVEHVTEEKRRREGIPLPGYVMEQLQELAERFHVPLDFWQETPAPSQ